MQTRVHRIRRRRDLGGGSFAVEVDGPVPQTLPGQFFMLRTETRWPVQLPRPFSLYDRGESGDWGSFLVKPIGPGTRAICDLEAGEGLVLSGPLGRPFPEDVQDPVCVAGGVGLAPFLLLARQHHREGRELKLLFGGRDRASLSGYEDFADIANVSTATEDGSHGFRGMVTGLLDQMVEKGDVRAGQTVFCCGPDPMMHAVAALCERHELRCFLSLETYMACGYGVCNGCTVAVQGERFRGWPYSKTCLEGPVYEACELAE
jgi:dihydroorotate dehydrogenase electron transfer subunit